jgi:hypothetical protein
MKKTILLMVLSGLLGYALSLRSAAPNILGNSELGKNLFGTKLKLAAHHGTLKLYVAQNSSNQFADFALFDGNQCVVLREEVENKLFETKFFENAFNVMLSKHTKDGKLIERTVSDDGGSARLRFTYFDSDGDGMWDVFLNHVNKEKYVRSNLCWVSTKR